MTSESKKGVHLIKTNHFLFYNTPEIYYLISLEAEDSSRIRIILLKITETDTYIYDAVVPYSALGTGDSNVQDTIKNVDYVIFNYLFHIIEGVNKIDILLYSKEKPKIELLLHDKSKDSQESDLYYLEQVNICQNKIQELLNKIAIQEQQINELQKREEMHINQIKKLEEVTQNLSNRLGNSGGGNNNNQYNNNNQCNNNNPYNNNNNNQYNNNNNFGGNNNNSYRANNNNPYNNNNNNNNAKGHLRMNTTMNRLPDFNDLNLNNCSNYPDNNNTSNFGPNPFMNNNNNINNSNYSQKRFPQ